MRYERIAADDEEEGKPDYNGTRELICAYRQVR